MLANKLMSALSGGAEEKLFSDDVFSTYLYTGNGSTQTINNGIDLAGKGGMVWSKYRADPNAQLNATEQGHWLSDTLRGSNVLRTNSTAAQAATSITFNSNGFAGPNSINGVGVSVASWTFRRAKKFFDIVTYTGNGVAGRQIPHELGITPGMIVVKSTSAIGSWFTWHRSASGSGGGLQINKPDPVNAGSWSASDEPSNTHFKVSADYATNINGVQYVAYLFAHDDSEDGIIQCGSFTPSGNAQYTIELGWEPQFIMTKRASSSGDWFINDQMRGLTENSTQNNPFLLANTGAAEASQSLVSPTATGFYGKAGAGFANGVTYIYLAIRRPNKPPTSGTEVYNAIARTGTGAAATVTGVGFAPDVCHYSARATISANHFWADRLRGGGVISTSTTTDAEYTGQTNELSAFLQDGVAVGTSANINQSPVSYINHFFRRAPGFFDVVCYTSNSTRQKIHHSLEVPVELCIFKAKNIASQWLVFGTALPNNTLLLLNDTAPQQTGYAYAATADYIEVNALGGPGITWVGYLFASLPGISKVGTYIGNGSTQTINCGFTTGARFILIKRTDAAGDWYVWDTARGIISANDPYLRLNSTAAEVTTNDSVDPAPEGFIVNQVAATNINVSGGQYIFLSVA